MVEGNGPDGRIQEWCEVGTWEWVCLTREGGGSRGSAVGLCWGSSFQSSVLQRRRGQGRRTRPLTCPRRPRPTALSALSSRLPCAPRLLRCALPPAAPAASPALDQPPQSAVLCVLANGRVLSGNPVLSRSSPSQQSPAAPQLFLLPFWASL